MHTVVLGKLILDPIPWTAYKKGKTDIARIKKTVLCSSTANT